jgi:uncharacterized membrane protein
MIRGNPAINHYNTRPETSSPSERSFIALTDSIQPIPESHNPPPGERSWWHQSFAPFRKAVVRGLAIVMPPLLTIVLFLWAWNIIDSYVLRPSEAIVRYMIVWSIADIRSDGHVADEVDAVRRIGGPGAEKTLSTLQLSPPVWQAADGTMMVKVRQGWIPRPVYDVVSADPGDPPPSSADSWYHRYVLLEFLPRNLVIPAFLSVFVLALYFLGRVFAVGFGRMIWGWIESIINRIPIISNVYGSVKQVTDFAFSDNELDFTRIVAVEYPRRGIWSMGFVTGESFIDVRDAAGEPCVSVLMPTSPMPATGFVISIPKSQTVDLNITVDQAIQFCVSCGVVVPVHQQIRTVNSGIRRIPAETRVPLDKAADPDE